MKLTDTELFYMRKWVAARAARSGNRGDEATARKYSAMIVALDELEELRALKPKLTDALNVAFGTVCDLFDIIATMSKED